MLIDWSISSDLLYLYQAQTEGTPKYELQAATEQHIAANFDVASSYPTCVGSREVQITTVNLGIFANF